MQSKGKKWRSERKLDRKDGFCGPEVSESNCCPDSGNPPPVYLHIAGESASGPPSEPIQDCVVWLPRSGPRGPDVCGRFEDWCWRCPKKICNCCDEFIFCICLLEAITDLKNENRVFNVFIMGTINFYISWQQIMTYQKQQKMEMRNFWKAVFNLDRYLAIRWYPLTKNNKNNRVQGGSPAATR